MTERQPPRTNRRWGIGHLLVVLVLAALAPFLVLETYRGVQDVARRREAVLQRAREQAEEEAITMDDFLRFTDRYLATLAADPAVRTLDLPRVEQLFQAVREISPNYENVFLVTLDGEQVASTVPTVSDPEIAEREYFRQALEQNRLALSGAVAWQDTDRSVVVFAQPVYDADGAPVAVLCAALNLARLNSVIGYVALPRDSVVLLVQADGTVIASSDRPEVWVGRSFGGLDVFEHARTRASGSHTGVLTDRLERVVAYEWLHGAPWLIMAGIPQAEVEAALRASLLRIGIQVALTGLATGFLTWIVLRRVVLPIRILADGARAFAAGFLNRRVPLRRRDELGDLADSLNQMAASLERRLEEEAAHARALAHLNQLQTEFVATASHELRTPVTAIRTYAEALLRPDILDEETRQECLAGIDRSSERLARLVRTLLDVSRIDSGRVSVALKPVDVAACISAAVAQAAPGAAGENVIVDLPPAVSPAYADPDRLEDVLANLIGNARKFSPADAPVTVRVRQDGDAVAIAVEDRGEGIPMDELPRIFDRFYRVERGAARSAGGSGLGLYIARAYIDAMGGRLWAESTPGAGSTFVVTVPAMGTPETVRTEEGDDAAVAGAARRR